jgi:glycosyltransferase involved in cell wall biosynthesis
MRINLFGQRNILGGGVHFSSFADALRAYAIFGGLVQEWDAGNTESLSKALAASSADDINIWFFRHGATPLFKGRQIFWAIFESDRLSRAFVEGLLTADLIWVPSRWGRDVLVAHGVPDSRVWVVPEGVDPHRYHPFSRNQREPIYRFLTLGKYEQRKGYDQLFEAFARAFRGRADVQLLIKGDYFINQAAKAAELNGRLAALALDNVKLVTGAFGNDDLSALYSYADGFVFPSRAEGWGLPLIEAIASGLPVAATNYSGHSEFLSAIDGLYQPVQYATVPITDPEFQRFWPSDDGQYGCWAQADIDDLARCMTQMVDDREQWAAKGRQASNVVRAMFNWSRAADAAYDCLRSAGLLPAPSIAFNT